MQNQRFLEFKISAGGIVILFQVSEIILSRKSISATTSNIEFLVGKAIAICMATCSVNVFKSLQ
jgi:hypothetical protein